MNLYKLLLRPVLFSFDPERIHHFITRILRLIFRIPGCRAIAKNRYRVQDPSLVREVSGLTFANPVGLAAGFDKNAELVDELECLGFGFIEIGTVTPEPQDGNPKPRMFRLPADKALINRMGFNNQGRKVIHDHLRKRKSKLIIGGNIGKNKHTPNEDSYKDYELCFRELFDVVDYFAVNVSSPNTPGLRALQEREPLTKMLAQLQALNKELSVKLNRPVRPVFLKIAPDLDQSQLDDIIAVVLDTKLAGIIATNTTISRAGLRTDPKEIERFGNGGVSGKPVTKISTEIIRYISSKSAGRFTIIGVGGIHSPEDALEKIQAGASLVQLYTGFIYEGPGLIRRINKALLR